MTAKIKPSRLKELSSELSRRYRQGIKPYLRTEEDHLAYLVTRFPATYAAIQNVLKGIAHLPITSLLDLGAGPGTGYRAAKMIFPDLNAATCIETDINFIKIGRQLLKDEPVRWEHENLEQKINFPEHDLVLLSYCIGEIPERYWDKIVSEAYSSAKQALVMIEPGTPIGFERIRRLREKALSLGGQMVAPCPHARACPMSGTDWCHFAVRLNRSSLHRQVKEGSLGFEDEKFSYVIVGKKPRILPVARILRHPLKQKGHVVLTLCTLEGIKSQVVTKRDKMLYKQVKKIDWGSKL